MTDDPLTAMLLEQITKGAPNGKTNGSTPRKLRLTRASQIIPRPVKWLWDARVPLGALALVGGREGVGKSTFTYQQAADITRGRLPGIYEGTPKAVIVAATEDSWEHTIVPRLMAADADLQLVLRVDVETDEGVTTTLTLPKDLLELEEIVRQEQAAMILLDPLLSRLSSALDTHKDAEVRVALEPLVSLADRCQASVYGLIHVNKGSSTDPLTILMGSRAFAAVARSVLFIMRDPEDEALRLLGLPKNNLGRTDLPTLAFTITSAMVAESDEGEIWTSRLLWCENSERTIEEAMAAAADGIESRFAINEATAWLRDFLVAAGGSEESSAIKKQGAAEEHSTRTLQRAAERLKLTVERFGFPKKTRWILPGAVVVDSDASEPSAGTTGTTGTTGSDDKISRPETMARLARLAPLATTSNNNNLTDYASPPVVPVVPCDKAPTREARLDDPPLNDEWENPF